MFLQYVHSQSLIQFKLSLNIFHSYSDISHQSWLSRHLKSWLENLTENAVTHIEAFVCFLLRQHRIISLYEYTLVDTGDGIHQINQMFLGLSVGFKNQLNIFIISWHSSNEDRNSSMVLILKIFLCTNYKTELFCG